ncbi:MAG: S8 family serine peptidase [Anaerolineae bacterium]|jgi:subtilisin family serine protease|nr:S8 family serine peptidase [Anaerolineae bacterium]
MGAPAPILPPYRPGVVLVGFSADTASASRARAGVAAQAMRLRAEIPALKMAFLETVAGQERAAIAKLRRLPGIAYAELDYAVQVETGLARTAHPDQLSGIPARFTMGAAHTGRVPTDPDFGQQWALSKINAPAAWKVTTGIVTITIAIVDTGVDLEHPDLAAKLWINPGEVPANGLDDDENGKIDDIHGWHFFHSGAENAFVQDDNGHGTHVAGIAAAATNNGIGVAGVAWGAQIMPVKVLDEYGNGWLSDVAAGIVYASDQGAKIINVSLGGSALSQTLCDAVAYASQTTGALVVAAAGNTGGAVLYPAACDHVLAVAATDRADQRAYFSNLGPQVDLAAPGVDIYSTWYQSGLQASGYFTRSGTSMATPQVAGVAALVWSRWPTWTPDQVSQRLLATALDLGEPGWDVYSGWGRLDAAAAVGVPVWRNYLPSASSP